MIALNESTSEPGLRPAARACRVTATYPQGGTGIPAGEINYPGAAAHMRPAAATEFCAVDATSGFGLSPNALNINGADTYQFVMGNPVDRADPTGLNVPCYKCLQILDQEKAQALHQIEQEAIGLGIPSLSAWKIVGTSVVLAGTLGTFGGPITGAVVLAIGLAEGGKKFIELHAMQEQIDAEISSDVAAFHNCMRNCCS